MNKNEILNTIAKYSEISIKAQAIITLHLATSLGELPINFSDIEIDIDENHINLTYSTGCRGSYDTEHYSCPTSCLWEENWREKLIEDLIIQKEIVANLKIEKIKQAELFKINNEKNLLLKLKEKYPNL